MPDTFSWSQVNHYLWRRQGFDRNADYNLRPVLENLTGIYSTSPALHLGVLARDPAFRFAELDSLLYERRGAVRMQAMRGSGFVINQTDFPAVFWATQERGVFMNWTHARANGLTEAEYPALAETIEGLLDNRTMTISEIKQAFPAALLPVQAQSINHVVSLLCNEGRLVRSRIRGGWKSNVGEYARFDQWMPGFPSEKIPPETAYLMLARIYFDSYGPATGEDFRWWAGLKKADGQAVLNKLRNELVTIQIEGEGYLIAETQLDALRSCPTDAPEGVRLLPIWDAYLMAYQKRERYLPDKWYEYVFDRSGNATHTVLMNGSIGGVWEFREEKKGHLVVKVALFAKGSQAVWNEIQAYVALLMEVAGYRSAELVRCEEPVTMKGGSQNMFMSPLKDVTGETIFTQ